MVCSCKAQVSQVLMGQVTSPLTTVVIQLVSVPLEIKMVRCSEPEAMILVWSDQRGNQQVSVGCECSCWI